MTLGCAAGSTKREPIVVGKPSDFVLSAISDTVGVPRNRMAMVGDRLDTDILFGQQGGLSTMLVLSGKLSSQVSAASVCQKPGSESMSPGSECGGVVLSMVWLCVEASVQARPQNEL